MDTPGERIAFLRAKAFKMNQAQFAEFVGAKGKSTVSNWKTI